MDEYGEKIAELSGEAWYDILDTTARLFEQQDNLKMKGKLSSFLDKWGEDGEAAWSYLTGSWNLPEYIDELENEPVWRSNQLHQEIVNEIDYVARTLTIDELYEEMQNSNVWYWNDPDGSYHMSDNQKAAFNDLFLYLTDNQYDFYALVDMHL